MNSLKLVPIFIILFIKISIAQTIIPDNTNISGNWTVANSPYLILGRSIVPIGQTLTIEPGVEIRLKSSSSPNIDWFNYEAGNVGVIRVQGEIIANGTANDPILFTRDSIGYWGSILIDENTSNNSSITYCTIEYAKETRNVSGITSTITFNAGISLYKSNIILSNNIIRKNIINGIYIKEVSSTFQFSNNIIFDNGANGLVIEESTVHLINNSFYSNSKNTSGYVSAIRSSNSTAYFISNLIYNNDDFGIFTTNGGNHYIINNTIYGNSQGIRVEKGANTYIHSSIIQNNNLNFATSDPSGASIEMQYCLTNEVNFPTNITNISDNIIDANAIFINADVNNFNLQPTSPCIDAGNSNTIGLNIPSTDIIGNPRINNGIIDIGAFEFQKENSSYMVTTSSNPLDGGNTSGDGIYTNGSDVVVEATPNSNYVFLNWTENGNVISTQLNYSFSISNDRSLIANFDNTVSVNESKFNKNDLILYPNPTSDIVKVDIDNLLFTEVYNIHGRYILNSTNKFIDIQQQPAGIYLLKIHLINDIEINKILIKN